MPYVLFSPIGGHDPIATDRDGSMLHICRKYHPDAVVLYLSKEITAFHRHDDRYRAAIRLLAEKEGFRPEIQVEERPDLAEVQVFDFFFQEFRTLIGALHSRYPRHQILLNIASGTPGMKSSLYLLAAFLPYKVLPVQVATPSKAHNPKGTPDDDYDVELYWACDKDNEDYRDRCREVQYENLNAQLQTESIKTHLLSYDYAAAFRQAERIRPLLSPRAYALLEAAKARVELNWRSIKPELRRELSLPEDSWDRGRPSQEPELSEDGLRRVQLSEYLLWLQMKQKRGDLSDFLRGLTPGLFGLLQIAVEEKGGYPLSSYCDGRGRFLRNAMAADEAGRELLRLIERPGRSIDGTFLISGHYVSVLDRSLRNAGWQEPLSKLRRVEEKARNEAAHTITRVDEKWLKGKGMPSSREIMKQIRDAVAALDADGLPDAGLQINWDSYDDMNQRLLQSLAEP